MHAYAGGRWRKRDDDEWSRAAVHNGDGISLTPTFSLLAQEDDNASEAFNLLSSPTELRSCDSLQVLSYFHMKECEVIIY